MVNVGRRGAHADLNWSCQRGSDFDARPAIRVNALVDAFGDQGSFFSLCDDSFALAMKSIGNRIRGLLGAQCLEHPPLDAGGRPVCHRGQVSLNFRIYGNPRYK